MSITIQGHAVLWKYFNSRSCNRIRSLGNSWNPIAASVRVFISLLQCLPIICKRFNSRSFLFSRKLWRYLETWPWTLRAPVDSVHPLPGKHARALDGSSLMPKGLNPYTKSSVCVWQRGSSSHSCLYWAPHHRHCSHTHHGDVWMGMCQYRHTPSL